MTEARHSPKRVAACLNVNFATREVRRLSLLQVAEGEAGFVAFPLFARRPHFWHRDAHPPQVFDLAIERLHLAVEEPAYFRAGAAPA